MSSAVYPEGRVSRGKASIEYSQLMSIVWYDKTGNNLP